MLISKNYTLYDFLYVTLLENQITDTGNRSVVARDTDSARQGKRCVYKGVMPGRSLL